MAIWHMERAYEVNPSNTSVQQEIRRLRGRRDGVEPTKLRLTRSALARMYIKGGLFGQAIAEIRQALTEDPDRPDLLILLASA
jgi:predicted Zn-dependent protease